MKKLLFEQTNDNRLPKPAYIIVQLETEKEREAYEQAFGAEWKAAEQGYARFEHLLMKELDVTDEEVYYYYMPGEKIPQVGELGSNRSIRRIA